MTHAVNNYILKWCGEHYASGKVYFGIISKNFFCSKEESAMVIKLQGLPTNIPIVGPMEKSFYNWLEALPDDPEILACLYDKNKGNVEICYQMADSDYWNSIKWEEENSYGLTRILRDAGEVFMPWED